MEKAARKIQENIADTVKTIKTNENLRAKDMEKSYQKLLDQINAELSNVKSKVNICQYFILSVFREYPFPFWVSITFVT